MEPDTLQSLQAAANEEAVFLLVQRHLEAMPEQAFVGLPEEFRPHLIRSADDVSRWALYFSRQDLTVPPGQGPRTVLRDMVVLFTTASRKLADIATRKAQRLKQ